MSVASEEAPVPLERKISGVVNMHVAPPSAAVVHPLSVTVPVSLSWTLNDPLPVYVTDGLLLVSTSLAENDSGPSANSPSLPSFPTRRSSDLTAPLLNDFVSEL